MRTFVVGRCLLLSLLRDRKMTQVDLAIITDISVTQINKYVHNKKEMSLGTAYIIASAINCKIEDLYEWVQWTR